MSTQSDLNTGKEEPVQAESNAETTPMSSDSQTVIVGIGASAGGLEALRNFFSAVPENSGIVFVVVQHLDPTHESLMADLLGRCTKMSVTQVVDQVQLEPNHVYVIPPNKDLAAKDGRLVLTQPTKRRGLRMPIDFFFTSLANDQRESAVVVILSGSGSDGTQGARLVKENGGMIMVQDPKTAQHTGMPSSAIATGLVDYVLEPDQMPQALSNYVQHITSRGAVTIYEEHEDLNRVLALLQAHTQHNFRFYKKTTLMRRINRRMGLHQIGSYSEYLEYLRTVPQEVNSLFKDLLISVTEFFRDAEAWEGLKAHALPQVCGNASSSQSIRVWVPGCATGEEAYTIGSLVLDYLYENKIDAEVQVFGTDIDERALEIARAGEYGESTVASVPPEYLARFFMHQDDSVYKVHRHLRDGIVFSLQNLISDPPFSRLDLISCRNLLIYLEPETQKKLIGIFHFALRPGGYLLLGNSETIGQNEDLFETVSKKWRIYRKINDSAIRSRKVEFPIAGSRGQNAVRDGSTIVGERIKDGISDVSRAALIEAYAPASVVINRQYEVLYFHGNTDKYLKQPSGEPTINLLELLRDGLRNRVRGAIHRSISEGEDVLVTGLFVERDGDRELLRLHIRPMQGDEDLVGLVMISFLPDVAETGKVLEVDSQDRTIVTQLEYEIKATRGDLQSTIEELETTNEELKAANEEVMSMNEELQSANEELETAKEELQSLNEELNTVNSQLQEKVEHLENSNDDLNNLISSTQVATIFLNGRLEIKRFTPQANRLFRLISTDIGRPLMDVSQRFDLGDLQKQLESVISDLQPSHKQVRADDGSIYLQRIMPYRTQENHIEGLVLTYWDITQLSEKEEELRLSEERLSIAVSAGLFGIFDRKCTHSDQDYYSDRWAQIFGYSLAELPSRDQMGAWVEERVHPDDKENMQAAYTSLVDGKSNSYETVFRIRHRSGQWRVVEAKTKGVDYNSAGKPGRLVGILRDITDERPAQSHSRFPAHF